MDEQHEWKKELPTEPGWYWHFVPDVLSPRYIMRDPYPPYRDLVVRSWQGTGPEPLSCWQFGWWCKATVPVVTDVMRKDYRW